MSAAHNLKPWKPGQSGNPAGRPKRTFPRVDQILGAAGREPVKELLALLPTLKEKEQMQLWLELLPYVHNRPTYSDEPSDLEKLSDQELVKLVKQAAKEL